MSTPSQKYQIHQVFTAEGLNEYFYAAAALQKTYKHPLPLIGSDMPYLLRRAEVYCNEIRKLEEAGYVAKVPPQEADQSAESWHIPQHMANQYAL